MPVDLQQTREEAPQHPLRAGLPLRQYLLDAAGRAERRALAGRNLPDLQVTYRCQLLLPSLTERQQVDAYLRSLGVDAVEDDVQLRVLARDTHARRQNDIFWFQVAGLPVLEEWLHLHRPGVYHLI